MNDVSVWAIFAWAVISGVVYAVELATGAPVEVVTGSRLRLHRLGSIGWRFSIAVLAWQVAT